MKKAKQFYHASLISPNSYLKQCFTLIELLVVVAIIAILAGMLMPALKNARDTGIQATCMNQHKTMATAVHIYADENEGFAPGIHTGTPGTSFDPGWSSNRRFLTIAGINYSKSDGSLYSYYWNEKYACPTLHQYANAAGTINGSYYYGFQNKPGGVEQNNDYWTAVNKIKISTMIVNPSGKVMIFDALQAPNYGGVQLVKSTLRSSYLMYKHNKGEEPAGDDYSYLGFRHLNDSRVVMSFYDGHVASLDQPRVLIEEPTAFKPRMYWFSKR